MKQSILSAFGQKITKMKKLLFSLLLAFVFTSVSAQEFWFEAGLKGGYGTSFLFNNNIADDSNWEYEILSPIVSVGGKFSMNFGPYHGVFIEGLYSQAEQRFKYSNPGSTEDLDYNIKYQSINTYLLYRGIKNRAYFEVGPMFSLIQEVEQGAAEPYNTTTDFYKSNYLAGVFGVGGYIVGAETFSIGIGMRLHYGFGDIVNDDGVKNNYPNEVAYPNAEKTNPMFAQFMVEFNFGVGRFAKTACSERFKRVRGRR